MYVLTDRASPPSKSACERPQDCTNALWIVSGAPRERGDRLVQPSLESETVRRLRRSIATGETIAAIAAHFGLTANRHRKAFRAVAGVGPGELRNWMRVDLALDVLHQNTTIVARELAAVAGLKSVAALNRLMIQLTGDDLETWRTLIAFDLMTARTRRTAHETRL